MRNKQNLTASLENYIKAISVIVNEKQAARVKDIAKYLNIGSSSVSEALKNLAEKHLINYEPYGIITLTPSGANIALDIINRHNVIRNFFENVLTVNPDDAEQSANIVAHNISENVLDKFVKYLEFMQACSCKEPKWIKSFKNYSQNNELSDNCKNCIDLKKNDSDKYNNNNCCGMIK